MTALILVDFDWTESSLVLLPEIVIFCSKESGDMNVSIILSLSG